MPRRLAVLLALALAATLLATATATATATTTPGAPQQKTSLDAVEPDLMCVSCGVPLAIADSPQADAERREVNRLIATGKTKKQVEDMLVEEYGRNVLASPKKSGFGLLAYLIPIALALLALIAGAFVLPRWKKRPRPESQPGTAPRLSDEDAERLDADLANYKL